MQVRFMPKEPLATIRIDDGKRVEISATAKYSRPEDTPTIYSDSPCVVAILQDYFERLWNEAIENNKRCSEKTRRTLQSTTKRILTEKSTKIKPIQV